MNPFVNAHTFKDAKRSITSSPRLLSFVLFLNPTHVFSNIASSTCTRTTSYAHIHGEKCKIHMHTHTHTGTQKDLLMWLPGMSLWTASLWASASYDYLTSSASLRCTHKHRNTHRDAKIHKPDTTQLYTRAATWHVTELTFVRPSVKSHLRLMSLKPHSLDACFWIKKPFIS